MNALAAGCVVIAIGLGLWRNLDRPLQLLTVVGGVIAATAGLVDLLGVAVWPIGIALFFASLGVAWLAVRGRLHPELWVLLVAGAGMMIGAGMLTDLVESIGMIFGLLTAAGVVCAGLALHRVPLMMVGVIGFLQYLIGVLQTYLIGAIGAIVVLVLGLAMVVCDGAHFVPPPRSSGVIARNGERGVEGAPSAERAALRRFRGEGHSALSTAARPASLVSHAHVAHGSNDAHRPFPARRDRSGCADGGLWRRRASWRQHDVNHRGCRDHNSRDSHHHWRGGRARTAGHLAGSRGGVRDARRGGGRLRHEGSRRGACAR